MNELKISVIIPFYKGDFFYSDLIKSINESILLCTINSVCFEIITIIDSIETTEQNIIDIKSSLLSHVKNLSIVVIKNKENIGVAASRNKAILAATGDFFHVIDQDDAVTKHFYVDAVPLLNSYNFILVNGNVNYLSAKYNSHKIYYLKPNITLIGLLKNDFIRSPGQVLFSKVLLTDKLFPEPKSYKGADDRFFWIRLFVENNKKIKVHYISKTNYVANIHNSNYSSDAINLKLSAIENWEIIRNELNVSSYNNIILRDIFRLKLSLPGHISFLNRITGYWAKIIYFLDPNKLIRFFFKRLKW